MNKEELELKKLKLEIKLKEVELYEKQTEAKRRIRVNQSILVALAGGTVGLVGTLINSWNQHKNNVAIERQKLNSSLILKAIETNDKVKSVENLRFFSNLNLIQDNGELRSLLNDSLQYMSVPALSESISNKSLITVTDSLKVPIAEVDLFYNTIFIGKTNKNGQVLAGFSTKELNNAELEVKNNGIEYEYIDVTVDKSNAILLRVKNR